MVQESSSCPVDGDTAWLSCHRKISGLESSKAASHTSSSFSSTERQRSTRLTLGREEEVVAQKRSIPRAQSVKEVTPRDTDCKKRNTGAHITGNLFGSRCFSSCQRASTALASKSTITRLLGSLFALVQSVVRIVVSVSQSGSCLEVLSVIWFLTSPTTREPLSSRF